MSLEQFISIFLKLADIYYIPKAQERGAAYYDYFQKFDENTFKMAVDAWIATNPRFPSVAELLSECRSKLPQKEPTKCDTCSGSGWVYVEGVEGVMRGNCEHARAISEKYGPIGFGGSKWPSKLYL